LAKASNTDLDYSWVTTDDTNAIQNAIVDAKGDLISATANDTPARLAVGNNGETLVADSSTSTGLRYQEPKATNPVLNSSFQVWQRGTSISVAASGTPYTADRWQVFVNANQASTVSRQLVGDSTNLPNIQYAARVQRNSGQTGTGGIYFSQNFESINSVPFAGKTVTLSFYARRGANYSATSNAFGFYLATGTGTDQNLIGSGYTGGAYPLSTTVGLTTTWQRFTVTGTLSTTTNEITLYTEYVPSGTAGANDYFELTGVQLEVGSVATPFKTYAGTIQGELAACQRYFQLLTPTNTFQDILTGASCDQTAYCRYPYVFPTIMRGTPTCSSTGTAGDYGNLVAAGFAGASSTPSFGNIRNTGVTIFLYSSSITTGQGTCLRNSTSFPSQWLTFSAEL
jgi:hypothetical protein